MKRILPVLLLLLVLNLTPAELAAQQTPPEHPIVTPINGQLSFSSNAGFVILNTIDGTWQPVPEGGDGVWDPGGNYLAFTHSEIASIKLFNTNSATSQSLISGQPNENGGKGESREVVGWSADSQNIMVLARSWSGGIIEYGSFSHRLEIVNIDSGAITVVLDIPPKTPMETLFPVPENTENVVLDSLYRARWNPVHPDWSLVQVVGVGKSAITGEDMEIHETGIYNHITRQYLSLKTLFPQGVISFTDWSADGRKMALTTMNDISLIEFSVQDGEPVLNLLADGVNSHGQSVLEWLGAGDLLITGTTLPYRTSFIAQIIDGRWYSREFIAFASLTPQYGGGSRDFNLTVNDKERNQLSCMLFDEVFSTQLKVGQQGNVGFTRRTPSHLRVEPALHAPLITEMVEDTTFEIIGGAYCVDDYRWWQIRLEDGTVGWAAEGHPPDYWLRPLNED